MFYLKVLSWWLDRRRPKIPGYFPEKSSDAASTLSENPGIRSWQSWEINSRVLFFETSTLENLWNLFLNCLNPFETLLRLFRHFFHLNEAEIIELISFEIVETYRGYTPCRRHRVKCFTRLNHVFIPFFDARVHFWNTIGNLRLEVVSAKMDHPVLVRAIKRIIHAETGYTFKMSDNFCENTMLF